MAPIVTIHCVEKTMGSRQLYRNLSLTVATGEKTAIVGGNGSGKSTLLKLILGLEQPDDGTVSLKKNLIFSYAEQTPDWNESGSVYDQVCSRLMAAGMASDVAEVQSSIYLSQVGFADLNQPLNKLSGGWKKRAAIACALALEPELLILDEPTNHLDWQGILWLENWIKKYEGTLLLVSHDRRFLNNCTNTTVELSGLYPEGYLKFPCPYYEYLEKKAEFIEIQLEQEKRMAGKVRRETEWLRAGVKARTTKSRSRIDSAHELIEQHGKIKQRNRQGLQKSVIEVDQGQKKSKKAVSFEQVEFSYGETSIFSELEFQLAMGQRAAILGDNGSGKTTLLKLITGGLSPSSGRVEVAHGAEIIYFDQARESLPQEKNLMQFLGDDSDYVVYRDQSIHVAAYASRFLFASEKMQLPIERLSGGEKARLLLAKLLLRPADILIMDEPTNDLDIETIEVLESALSDFPGLLLLVSHDRQFLESLCDRYLAIQDGSVIEYGDLDQWLQRGTEKKERPTKSEKPRQKNNEKKLKKQLQDVERQIEKLETRIAELKVEMADPNLASDHEKLTELSIQNQGLEVQLQELYLKWEELQG